jgi:hypothetical protein
MTALAFLGGAGFFVGLFALAAGAIVFVIGAFKWFFRSDGARIEMIVRGLVIAVCGVLLALGGCLGFLSTTDASQALAAAARHRVGDSVRSLCASAACCSLLVCSSGSSVLMTAESK